MIDIGAGLGVSRQIFHWPVNRKLRPHQNWAGPGGFAPITVNFYQ